MRKCSRSFSATICAWSTLQISIGLKVQSSSNDPRRHRLDVADIAQLLRFAPDVDMTRVREYFRLFEREAELDSLLAEIER